MEAKRINRDEVFGNLRQYYFQRVEKYCIMFLNRVSEAIEHDECDEYELREHLSQITDDACSYYIDNAITLAASDNDNAYIDDFGTDGIVDDRQLRFDRLACSAFMADVLETLDRAGFGWADPEGTVEAACAWFND